MDSTAARGSHKIRIRLLGPFQMEIDGEPVRWLHSLKEHWLIAILALRNGREISRSQIATMLWPDSSDEHALANLRSTLYKVRQTLGSEACRLQAPTARSLRLDVTGMDIDILALQSGAARGDAASLEAAADLYRGPLLEGCDEAWVSHERQQFEQQYLQAIESLATHAASSGDLSKAIHHLRLLIQRDPYRESAHRALMRHLTEQGDYSAMLLVYRSLRRLLSEEMSSEPDEETAVLYRSLRELASKKAAGRAAVTQGDESTALKPSPSEIMDAPEPPSDSAAPTGRIPRTLTQLIGRGELISEVQSCLETAALVTLLGTGGVGKTRLAIQVAEEWACSSEVCFVELASISDPHSLATEVVRKMGVRDESGKSIEESVAAAIGTNDYLLVLDNCEHLLDECSALTFRLLRSCRSLRILVTSRHALGIPGEVTYPVAPLETPGLQVASHPGALKIDKGTISALMAYSAIHLFVQRAQAVSSSFRLTAENGAAVASICSHLDGIPLAIELAAARIHTLAPQQILERLQDRFKLLATARKTGVPHHQTLRASLDWSYSLLAPKAQKFLNRLSVFSGGWALEMAELICADPTVAITGDALASGTDSADPSLEITSTDVLDLLSGLVEQSLVQVEAGGENNRYRLLESIRHHALEHLEASGERESVRGLHASSFVAFAINQTAHRGGGGQRMALLRLDAEHDNMREALHWALQEGMAPLIAVQICLALRNFWVFRGYYREGRDWCQRALDALDSSEPTEEQAHMAGCIGTLSWLQGDLPEAYRLLSSSLVIWRSLDNSRGTIAALERTGAIATDLGQFEEAKSLLEESVALARTQNLPLLLAIGLINLGNVLAELDMEEAATSVWEEGLEVARLNEDSITSAIALSNLGGMAELRNEYVLAERLHRESLQIMRDAGDKGGIAICSHCLAGVLENRRDYANARFIRREALTLWRDLGNRAYMIIGIEGFVLNAISQARSSEGSRAALSLHAAILLGAAANARILLKCPRVPTSIRLLEKCITFSLSVLDEAEYYRAFAVGQALSLESAVLLALQQ